MSGDRPTLPEAGRPVHGTAAGTAYLALPPTAVDARPSGPTRLVVAWPGFDPPRTAAALAAAMPLTGVPTWRVYLELTAPGGAPSEGLGSGALLEARGVEAYAAAVEGAVESLPAVLAALRADLGIEEGPVGLAGFSVGASIALLALARGTVPVSAAALVTPVLAPARAATSLERLAGRERDWDDRAAAAAERLDLAPLAERIAGGDAAVLLIAGAKDRVVSSLEITELRDRLREHGLNAVEAATFRMGHAMAAQPGIDAQPPTTEAVRVDGVLNDWFRERLAVVTDPGGDAEPHPGHLAPATADPVEADPVTTGPAGAGPVPVEPAARAAETVTQPFSRPAGGSMTGTGAGLDAGSDAGHGFQPTPGPGFGSGSAGSAPVMGFGTVRSPMGEYPADLSQAIGLGCHN
ncbi:hypothetical protein [Actinomadura rugatobispora]|uniref:Peptidase S9 prolyl oligopeptidase catalytic domain-containing protein n=1 Tax=Actinomadura rugatobispora TaxID=1994 RepID=A0ABW1A6F6_9ACTN|nr:hypothetical protein GCM10010200_045210 [Actinomadura rugatobispora]